MTWEAVTPEEWARLREHLPPENGQRPKGGRPLADARRCFNGILWLLWTGAPWSALPQEYGTPSTVHRRWQKWTRDGTLETLMQGYSSRLNDKGQKPVWDADGVPGRQRRPGSTKSRLPSKQKLWSLLMSRVLNPDWLWARPSFTPVEGPA